MADPATSPASLVVAASSFDASFFSDLVCATITTAGAVTIAPGVVTNTYLTGTPIIDLLTFATGAS